MTSLYEELQALEERIDQCESTIKQIFKEQEACQRLAQVEGVGFLIATAVVAAIGQGDGFKEGRPFAAWLGLVPRQHSTGGKPRLLGISKRGDRYLRCLLIHGSRSVVRRAPLKRDPRSQWIMNLLKRKGPNKTAVALANRNARVLWALLSTGQEYRGSQH